MPRSAPRRAARAPRLPLLAAAIVLAATAGGWYLWGRAPTRSGAVVLISIDTLRADRLPLYGYQPGRTPVLDAFARDAVLIERAYAHAPQTLPSHASMLTGLLPFEHGVRDNLGFTLKAETPTLASVLGAAGYRTAGFVSAYVLRADTGIGHGFATYDAQMPASSE
jgi:arylsulfatase A-like enzyme